MVQQNVKVYPQCPHCNRTFTPGKTWLNANFCRATFLTAFLKDNPNLTTWELSQKTEMLYSDAVKGMAKAREWGLVICTAEERNGGGIRYRYKVAEGANNIINTWTQRQLI